MRPLLKKILLIITAITCLAPAAAISGSAVAEDLVYSYDFSHTYSDGRIADNAVSTSAGVACGWYDASCEVVSGGYGSNTTEVLKITKAATNDDKSRYASFYHLGTNVRYNNADGSRRYIVVNFKIYTDGEGLEYVSLGNEWGTPYSVGVSMEGATWSNPEYPSPAEVAVPSLKRNEWNEVTFVTYFDNKQYTDRYGTGGGYAYYDAHTDIYVNGALADEDRLWTGVKNPKAVNYLMDDEHLEIRLLLKSKFTLAPKEEGFTAYIDDVKAALSNSKPALPALAASDRYEVDEAASAVSVFAGTTVSGLKAKNETDTVTAYNGGAILGAAAALSQGNIVAVTNAYGIKKEYTVKIIASELSISGNSLTYTTDGETWNKLERFGGELKAAEYAYRAQVKNATGETKAVAAALARYNSGGKLIAVGGETQNIESRLGTQAIETSLSVANPAAGEYIKGFIIDTASMKPLAEAAATNKKNGPLKILIIGNSITQHDYAPSLGWYGRWGMAATAEDKDYVHLLQSYAKAKAPDTEFKVVNVWDFERYFYNLDNISESKFKEYVDFDADIIVASFGANINNSGNENDPSFETGRTFNAADYVNIIRYFNPKGDARIIPVLTTLTKSEISREILKLPAQTGWQLVNTSDLTAEKYTARPYKNAEVFGENVIDGVLNHPGDLGMQVMAERIWAVLAGSME